MEESKSHMGEAMTSTVNALEKEMSGEGGEQPTPGTVNPADVASIIESWGDTPQEVARQMIDRYGPPNEATNSRLIWFDNGPWKRTIVYRDEVPHNFPKPHTDLLEQFIDYRVPPDRFDDLALYDGSVVPERTKGEISARCDMEEMNFLALNLADEIVRGQRSVEDARETYARTALGFMRGRQEPYTHGLRFDVAEADTADVDETMLTEAMIGQLEEPAGEPPR